MSYKMENGIVLNDANLEKIDAEYESGECDGYLEDVVIGVPHAGDVDELTMVSLRLPKSRIEAINAAIANHGMSKSEFYQKADDRELLALA